MLDIVQHGTRNRGIYCSVAGGDESDDGERWNNDDAGAGMSESEVRRGPITCAVGFLV